MSERVVILGASAKPERFANRAHRMLQEHDHRVVPINPTLDQLDGNTVLDSLNEVEGTVDTVTVYLRAELSSGLESELVALSPGRVIFNPGSENPPLARALDQHGIPVQCACTLVLLRSGEF
jgi:predicted CoA-binding protein